MKLTYKIIVNLLNPQTKNDINLDLRFNKEDVEILLQKLGGNTMNMIDMNFAKRVTFK